MFNHYKYLPNFGRILFFCFHCAVMSSFIPKAILMCFVMNKNDMDINLYECGEKSLPSYN